MDGSFSSRLQAAASLPPEDRIDAWVQLGRELAGRTPVSVDAGPLIEQLVSCVQDGSGDGKQRLAMGEVLGHLGDPRLLSASDDDYWAVVPSDQAAVVMGRFLVTNREYQQWVDAGGYDDRDAWSERGWAWLEGCDNPWPVNARGDESKPFVVANQPVVGVTFWEAQAFAKAQGARLPRTDERVWVCRGQERRPYPWGSPFGEGNANTREEVLERPCAVGLYVNDRTPEGIWDLAGNAAEWTSDEVGADRLIHPGSWEQPSMAAWAKALALRSPDARSAGLGFRLARDA